MPFNSRRSAKPHVAGVVFRTGEESHRVIPVPCILEDSPPRRKLALFEHVLCNGTKIHDCVTGVVDAEGRERLFVVAWQYTDEDNKALLSIYPDFPCPLDLVVLSLGTKGQLVSVGTGVNRELAISAVHGFIKELEDTMMKGMNEEIVKKLDEMIAEMVQKRTVEGTLGAKST